MPVGMSYNKSAASGEQESSFEYLRAKIVTGKGAGRVYFLDKMEEGFDGQGQPVQVYRSYKFDFADLPDFPKLPEDAVIEECQVVYDNKNDKIIGIGPYNGSFRGKAIDLGPKTPDGSAPMSRIQNKPDKKHPGKSYKDVNFWAIYQVTDKEIDGGLWLGAKGFCFLKDKFYNRGDGFVDIIGDSEKANTHATKLREWGDQHHLWEEDIQWPADGNVLPELLRRLQERGDEVLLIFKKGMINEVQAIRTGGVVRQVAVFKDDDIVPVATPALPTKAGQADDTFGK